MAHDHLLAPLDSDRRTRGASIPLLALAFFVAAASLMGVILWISLAGDDSGGEPQVVLPITPVTQVAADAPPETGRDAPAGEIAKADAASGAEPSPWSSGERLAELRDDDPSETALAPAPDPELIEQSKIGPLPKIAADGRRPLDVYAARAPQTDGLPVIAIVVRGLGLSRSSTQAAIDNLPPEVTLSFVPYGKDLQSWVNVARATGHEVMLELPMEPFGYPDNDPGPYTLLTSLSPEENQSRLHWLLSRFTGYVGVTNYLGERFVASKGPLDNLFGELQARGLLYLDDNPSKRSLVEPLAQKHGLLWRSASRSLDRASTATIDQDLTRLEAEARANGFAVGTGYSFPVTVQTIADWAKTLEQKDLRLVPLTATIKLTASEANVAQSPDLAIQ